MGKFRVSIPDSHEPRELRCTYIAAQPVVISIGQINGWADFVDALPNSYEFIVNDRDDKVGVAHAVFTYQACGANSNDIKRRLRQSNLEFVTGKGDKRIKVCGCPEGTKKCLKRIS